MLLEGGKYIKVEKKEEIEEIIRTSPRWKIKTKFEYNKKTYVLLEQATQYSLTGVVGIVDFNDVKNKMWKSYRKAKVLDIGEKLCISFNNRQDDSIEIKSSTEITCYMEEK